MTDISREALNPADIAARVEALEQRPSVSRIRCNNHDGDESTTLFDVADGWVPVLVMVDGDSVVEGTIWRFRDGQVQFMDPYVPAAVKIQVIEVKS
ncbi:hypothetical protein [Marivita sp.]|uniref:hypothetical protein n=1 Tax=Marivita sp. TaxID=2003365 RepID=UPI003F6F4368